MSENSEQGISDTETVSGSSCCCGGSEDAKADESTSDGSVEVGDGNR